MLTIIRGTRCRRPGAFLAALVVGIAIRLASGDAAAQQSQRLAVAAASDLQAVLPDIARAFERSSGAVLTISYGASGTFFAQIRNGAPFDVFLSADIDYPRQLAQAGLGDPATLYTYATGHLVLWTRRDGNIDIGRGLAVLTDARIRHVAIANPQHAPYGRAAIAALKNAQVYAAVEKKLVLGENIAQTSQLVQSGNAEAGLVSLSLALGPTLTAEGTYAEIPAGAYPPIEQGAIAVRASTRGALARQFIAYLRQNDSQERLRRFGLTPPGR